MKCKNTSEQPTERQEKENKNERKCQTQNKSVT